jgi:hypothetical protein
MSISDWLLDHQNKAEFVMIDGSGNEVSGLAGTLTMLISKDGGAFNAAAGTQSEIGNGWYRYVSTVAESDTVGPVAIVATGAGAIQQNLEYVVSSRADNMTNHTYTVTRSDTGAPISGAVVNISTDLAGDRIIWGGLTDDFGVARHIETGDLPLLEVGRIYHFWTKKVGYSFNNPDSETIT